LVLFDNDITSNVMGVMLIDRLTAVITDATHVDFIINKHIKTDRDMFICQDEMIKAGFAEYAQL
jgi:hypothetical protein